MPEELAETLRLSVGRELGSEEQAEIEEAAQDYRWYEKAIRFISYRPRSIQEVRQKLKILGAVPEEVEPLINRLIAEGVLDDRKFSEAWLMDRDAVRPMGSQRLRLELRAKGVDPEVIADAMSERDDEAEFEQAKALASRNEREWRLRTEAGVKQKIYSKLRRRGYSSAIISKVFSEED
jgi:regulatory protein